MNVLAWNCCGTKSRGFASLVKEISKEHKASFVVLVETHLPGDRARKIINHTGFDSFHLVKFIGQVGVI